MEFHFKFNVRSVWSKISLITMKIEFSLLDSFVRTSPNVYIQLNLFHYFEDRLLSKSINNEFDQIQIDQWFTVVFFIPSAKYCIPIAPDSFDARINVVNVYRSSSRSSLNVRRWFTWFCFKPLDRHWIAGGLREFPWRLRVVNVWKDFLLKEYSMKAEIQATLFICNTLPRCSIPDWLIELRARFNVVNV